MKAQEITLVLSDGRKYSFVGQAFCEEDEIENLSLRIVKVHPPFELPSGYYFEALNPSKNSVDKP